MQLDLRVAALCRDAKSEELDFEWRSALSAAIKIVEERPFQGRENESN
jgi:hypothetical protein